MRNVYRSFFTQLIERIICTSHSIRHCHRIAAQHLFIFDSYSGRRIVSRVFSRYRGKYKPVCGMVLKLPQRRARSKPGVGFPQLDSPTPPCFAAWNAQTADNGAKHRQKSVYTVKCNQKGFHAKRRKPFDYIKLLHSSQNSPHSSHKSYPGAKPLRRGGASAPRSSLPHLRGAKGILLQKAMPAASK